MPSKTSCGVGTYFSSCFSLFATIRRSGLRLDREPTARRSAVDRQATTRRSGLQLDRQSTSRLTHSIRFNKWASYKLLTQGKRACSQEDVSVSIREYALCQRPNLRVKMNPHGKKMPGNCPG